MPPLEEGNPALHLAHENIMLQRRLPDERRYAQGFLTEGLHILVLVSTSLLEHLGQSVHPELLKHVHHGLALLTLGEELPGYVGNLSHEVASLEQQLLLANLLLEELPEYPLDLDVISKFPQEIAL